MAYQTETPAAWPAGVYQIAVTDPVLGGSDGAPNVMGAALAKRALYQRMRNVTAWDAELAAVHDYPAGACVRHGVTTWRAIVDNNVEPGTDPLKWERWAFSESELDAKIAAFLPYGAPTACADTGPDGAANKTKIHKSSKNEYWMWVGDAWRVVAGRHGYQVTSSPFSPVANQNYYWASYTAHRAGELSLKNNYYTSALGSTGRLGVAIFKNGTSNYVAACVGDFNDAGGSMDSGVTCSVNVVAAAGDVFSARIVSWNVSSSGLASFSADYLK